jgi:hypothetical protein
MLAGSLGAPLTAILSSREVTYCRPALPMASIEGREVIVWRRAGMRDHNDFEGPALKSQSSDKLQKAIAIDCSQLAPA